MHAPEYCGLLWELPLVGASFKTLQICHSVLCIPPPPLEAVPKHLTRVELLSAALAELLPETNTTRVITESHLYVKV